MLLHIRTILVTLHTTTSTSTSQLLGQLRQVANGSKMGVVQAWGSVFIGSSCSLGSARYCVGLHLLMSPTNAPCPGAPAPPVRPLRRLTLLKAPPCRLTDSTSLS